jgi:hypothetical protein
VLNISTHVASPLDAWPNACIDSILSEQRLFPAPHRALQNMDNNMSALCFHVPDTCCHSIGVSYCVRRKGDESIRTLIERAEGLALGRIEIWRNTVPRDVAAPHSF